MHRIFFEEEQRFDQPWLWVLLALASLSSCGALVYGLFTQLVSGIPWGDHPMSDGSLLLLTLFVLMINALMMWIFAKARLETRVDREGVHFRYFPFVPKWHTIAANTITHFEIRKYLLRGYGVRYGLDGVKTFNVKGRYGMLLQFNNKKRMIGTQLPEAFESALHRMKKERQVNE